ncbi:GGDEF domain-containing protein OS=Lysinibacillus sphaericus OX=1421 GN=LS41612_06090 PE=4 SV=1 [Lysinibacillus sphaericus]
MKNQTKKFQDHFKTALQTMKPAEYQQILDDGYIETYRFLPYEAETVRGASTKRVVYVKYGNRTELTALANNTKQFWYVLMIALVTALIMLVVINRLFSKTIHLATYDPLTNVYNRATYISKMDKLLKKRKANTPGLLLIDLDNFKQVNDRFGHAEGDRILIETAKILKDVVRTEGFVVRFGGDEFAIVLYDTNNEHMVQVASAILEKIRRLKNVENHKWSVISVSMGGVICEKSNESELSLFERADKALYQSKKAGNDQYSSYHEVASTEEKYNQST